MSCGIGVTVHVARRLLGGCAGVHSYSGKVVANARLHKCKRRRIERLTGRAQNIVHDRRGFGLASAACADGLQLQALVFFSRLLLLAVRAGSFQAHLRWSRGSDLRMTFAET